MRRKKLRRKKLKIKNIIKLLIIILLIINFYNYITGFISTNDNFKTIKLDYIESYSGIGQEKTKNKDGYFSTFTTGEEYNKTYIFNISILCIINKASFES